MSTAKICVTEEIRVVVDEGLVEQLLWGDHLLVLRTIARRVGRFDWGSEKSNLVVEKAMGDIIRAIKPPKKVKRK